jgi:hypothetical protein
MSVPTSSPRPDSKPLVLGRPSRSERLLVPRCSFSRPRRSHAVGVWPGGLVAQRVGVWPGGLVAQRVGVWPVGLVAQRVGAWSVGLVAQRVVPGPSGLSLSGWCLVRRACRSAGGAWSVGLVAQPGWCLGRRACRAAGLVPGPSGLSLSRVGAWPGVRRHPLRGELGRGPWSHGVVASWSCRRRQRERLWRRTPAR